MSLPTPAQAVQALTRQVQAAFSFKPISGSSTRVQMLISPDMLKLVTEENPEAVVPKPKSFNPDPSIISLWGVGVKIVQAPGYKLLTIVDRVPDGGGSLFI